MGDRTPCDLLGTGHGSGHVHPVDHSLDLSSPAQRVRSMEGSGGTKEAPGSREGDGDNREVAEGRRERLGGVALEQGGLQLSPHPGLCSSRSASLRESHFQGAPHVASSGRWEGTAVPQGPL